MMASGRRSWISGGVAGGGGGRDDSAKGGVDVLEATSIFLSVMMSSSLARLRTSNTSKSFDTNHGDSIPPLDQVSLRRTRSPFAGPRVVFRKQLCYANGLLCARSDSGPVFFSQCAPC